MQLLFTLFLAIILNLPAPATIIHGHNSEYSGKELRFFRYSDAVTREKIYMFSLQVDQQGNFRTEADIGKTTSLFCDFGIYRGLLILQPGGTTELLLPPVREKSFAESKNPYFEPVEFWFLTSKGDQLNDEISKFDNELNKLTDKYFTKLYIQQSKETFDSLTYNLDAIFNSGPSETFKVHKLLKLKSVETDVFRLLPAALSETFDKVNPVYWDMPAFMELFDKTFANKLSLELSMVNNEAVKRAAFNADTKFFINLAETKYRLKGTAKYLAILKMLHDVYYTGEIPARPILSMISSGSFSENHESAIRNVAANLLKKLTYLSPGTPAPVTCLKDTDGKRVCTDNGTDKYKYLVFADTEMIICREQLKYLQKIEETFSQYLDIIVIIKKSDLIEMKIFLNKNNIPGIHLIDEINKSAETYQIKSFPQCFLLDKKHQIIYNQAKAPLDGFEQQFGTYLQKKLHDGGVN